VNNRDQVQVIAAKSRVDRVADRALRETQRKARNAAGRRRPTRPEADAFKARVAALTEAHKIEFERVDWDDIVEMGPVAPDISRDSVSAAAKRALMEYRPSVMDSLLGREKDRRRELQAKISEAAKADVEIYQRAKAYADRHNQLLKLALDVRAMKLPALSGALKANGVTEALEDVVEGLALATEGPGRLVALVTIPEFDAIPEERCSMGPAGASYSEIPMTDRCQMQLACATSLVLRVAAEVLQVVPVEAVEVIARQCRKDDDGSDLEPVLHVRVPLAAPKRIPLKDMEPAQALTAMGARLDWSDARGLNVIRLGDLGAPARAA